MNATSQSATPQVASATLAIPATFQPHGYCPYCARYFPLVFQQGGYVVAPHKPNTYLTVREHCLGSNKQPILN